jgi:riboflavin synthase
MFTGIIETTSVVTNARNQHGGFVVSIKPPRGWKLRKGQSVSVNGVCSTVAGVAKKLFEVEYMPETISKTTVGEWRKGKTVNLERPVTPATMLGGHIVQGHVDGRASVENIERHGSSKVVRFAIPKQLARYLVPKGSVCVDGVSLTVVAAGRDWFTVSLVAYTLAHTNLGYLKRGDKVNVEVDVLGKYVERLLKHAKE